MKSNYLLTNIVSERLYSSVKDLPISDYHCHLPAKEIYEDSPFDNIGELWLKYDHYKWRLKRAAGIDEKFITGNKSWHDKFIQFIKAVSVSPGNPLYQWTRMELSRFFDIGSTLQSSNAEEIWERANSVIKDALLSPRKVMAKSKVVFVATTDDIADSLEYHKKLNEDKSFNIEVTPSFRTDRLLLIEKPDFPAYIRDLSMISGTTIKDIDSLMVAIKKRLDAFSALKCRFSDVGIPYFPYSIGTAAEANAAFLKALKRVPIDKEEYHHFLGFMYLFLAKEYLNRGIVMQWHIGVHRNANTKLFSVNGADSGGDCVGDAIHGEDIIRILDAINRQGMPTTIIYSLNPNNVFQIATIAGSFRNVYCGPAWWFNDNRRGIEEQLNILAETGCLGAFPGMLTDSRSFLSYVRHDYFRRILCDVLSRWVQSDGYPETTACAVAESICYSNISKIVFGK